MTNDMTMWGYAHIEFYVKATFLFLSLKIIWQGYISIVLVSWPCHTLHLFIYLFIYINWQNLWRDFRLDTILSKISEFIFMYVSSIAYKLMNNVKCNNNTPHSFCFQRLVLSGLNLMLN